MGLSTFSEAFEPGDEIVCHFQFFSQRFSSPTSLCQVLRELVCDVRVIAFRCGLGFHDSKQIGHLLQSEAERLHPANQQQPLKIRLGVEAGDLSRCPCFWSSECRRALSGQFEVQIGKFAQEGAKPPFIDEQNQMVVVAADHLAVPSILQ